MDKTQTPIRFFRNVHPVKDQDAGALWKLDEENRVLVLVDEDQYVTIPAPNVTMMEFYEVEDPLPIKK